MQTPVQQWPIRLDRWPGRTLPFNAGANTANGVCEQRRKGKLRALIYAIEPSLQCRFGPSASSFGRDNPRSAITLGDSQIRDHRDDPVVGSAADD